MQKRSFIYVCILISVERELRESYSFFLSEGAILTVVLSVVVYSIVIPLAYYLPKRSIDIRIK